MLFSCGNSAGFHTFSKAVFVSLPLSLYSYFDREWSLMVLDKYLTVLDEIIFPAKVYNFQEICVTKDGLLISQNNENNPDFNPSVLSYKLIKFKDE